MSDIYSTLNPQQQEAVYHTEGPLLILAGAGSGKTRVLTHRIAYLIDEKGVNPWNILAITFTNKAASEMRERVDKIVGFGSESIWVSTFHSTCVRILRRHIDRLGFDNRFAIYDTEDQKTLMKEICRKLNIDTKIYKERSLLAQISHAKDELIILDTYSGSVHVVDDIAYDIIGMYEQKSTEEIVAEIRSRYPDCAEATEEEIRQVCADVETLKQQGQLFTPDTYASKATALKEKSAGVVKALCLHVAHSCNLNCSYCFASQGKYHGDRALMSFEVGKQALDFLVAHSGTRHNLEVDFFGGEPLMNFDVVKQLVAYARSIEKKAGKNFRFTLTTNGVLIDDDVIDFANREMSNVVLSLDGRKEVHDRFRVDYAGKGSWERIVPKFQKLVEARGGKNYYMRGTFTHHNPDFLKDIQEMNPSVTCTYVFSQKPT